MGLDIYNRDGDILLNSFCEDIFSQVDDEKVENEEELRDQITELLEEYEENGQVEKLDEAMEIVKTKLALKESSIIYLQEIADSIKMLDSYNMPADCAQMVQDLQWIYENEEVQDSRMGGYSMIHNGRMFATLVYRFYERKNENVMTSSYRLTEEDLDEIVIEFANSYHTDYASTVFNSLCNHSDCDGCYTPTETATSFDVGSSIELLKELYRLYELNIFTLLKNKIDSIKALYPEPESASEEVHTQHYICKNAYWVLTKMLWHAVSSVEYGEEIHFG